jgi:hypothetical protein
MKRTFFTYIGLLLVVAIFASETTLNIFRTDKSVQRFGVETIDRITTNENEGLLQIERLDGNLITIPLAEIDSMTYSEGDYALPTVSTVSVNSNINAGQTDCIVEVSDDGGCLILERGVVWSSSGNPTIEHNKYSSGLSTGQFYGKLSELNPEETYYVRGYATNCMGTTYGNTRLLEPMSGNVTYTLAVDPAVHPQYYDLLKTALDSACYYYNKYTTFEANIDVYYNDGIPTAQASYRGSIGYGPNTTYMWVGTTMHEMAHYFGSGTTQAWKNLMVGGVWQGPVAQALCQEIAGTNLKGDNNSNPIHYWPTGINYRSEVSSVQDLIDHARIVQAMIVEDAGISNK